MIYSPISTTRASDYIICYLEYDLNLFTNFLKYSFPFFFLTSMFLSQWQCLHELNSPIFSVYIYAPCVHYTLCLFFICKTLDGIGSQENFQNFYERRRPDYLHVVHDKGFIFLLSPMYIHKQINK